MATNDQLAAALRSHKSTILQQGQVIQQLATQVTSLQQMIVDQQSRPRSVQEEIDAIEGRRLEGTLSAEIAFDASDEGNQGQPLIMQVSQDGPFVMTHYPLFLWYPTAPEDTTNLNRWRPVSSFPLPTQQVQTDWIDLKYQIQDGGNKRLLQNMDRGPLFSRPDNIVPCPIPTLWSPNSTIKVIPTYLSFTWNSAEPPTAGILHVDLIGYYIANL